MAVEDMDVKGAGAAGDDTPEAREARRRLFVRMSLIREFGLDSAFIGVPKLARILGLSPNTVWSYMRQGKFFIPYRKFNTSPVVCIDDLVDWYCGRGDLVLPAPDAATLADMRAAPAPMVDKAKIKADGDAAVDAIVANVLASMGLEPGHARTRARRQLGG